MLVVKIGGTTGLDLEAVCADVAAQVKAGERLVIVHGGSGETNAISEQLGHPPRFVTSPSGFTSRYTDRETLEIFAMVTTGKINTLLVEALQSLGVNAFGLSGVDGRLMVAHRKEAIRVVENGKQRVLRDDYTGKIEKVNTELLRMLLDAGYVPVVAPLAISPEGVALNVDADRAAAMVAGAVGADKLILLTNVPGLLREFPDESTLIAHIDKAHVEESLAFAEGRMKKKVLGASGGVGAGRGRGRVRRWARAAPDCQCPRRERDSHLVTIFDTRVRLHLRRVLQAPARDRARRGRAPVGQRRQRVHRLCRRAGRSQPGPRQPGGCGGHGPPGGDADLPARDVLQRPARGAARTAGRDRARRACAACSSPTLAPRPSRPRSSLRVLATGRKETVAAMRGFHGRTMGALSATWEKKYREPFEPLVPGFRHIPYNDLAALAQAVTEQTAGVLLEVVQGEGGVRPGTAEFLRGAQALCRERGAMLIIDEVQTGLGRTGKMFAVEHSACSPT